MLHMHSNESFTNIFDNTHSQELFGIGKKKAKKEQYKPDEKTLIIMRRRSESYSMSTESGGIYFISQYEEDYDNDEYEKIFKKKIQKNAKYNKDLPLKVYNYLAHNIGFKGGFPRLKRFFKILSGKDDYYNTAGIEYITDKNGEFDDPKKPPVTYGFTVYTLSPPFKKDDKVKFNKFRARLSERNEIAKKKIKEVYPSAKMQITITPMGVENDDGEKYDCFVQNFHVTVPLSFFDIDLEKSGESLFNDDIEQNNVLSFENALFSMEDDDASSFEDAAEESSGGDDSGGDDTGGGDGWGDDSGGDSGGDDGGWGDDSGGDDGWGDDTGDGGDDSGDGDGESSGIDVIDNNKGSSLNPFTQINHKIYTLDTLNVLSNSIKNSLDLYNDRYADWSEVIQLNDLSEIVDEEKRSFMMQQNPENDIKLGLYLEQYKTIVQNISYRIKVLKSNNKA